MIHQLVSEINSKGWHVHMIWQDPDQWGATLRQSLPGRAPIAHGYGPTIEDALHSAIDSIPQAELEDEVQIYHEAPKQSNLKNLLAKLGLAKVERRRA